MAGESFKEHKDDFTTYTINRLNDQETSHYEIIEVHGDEALRDKILEILND